MERPEHWEPWWDRDVITLGSDWTRLPLWVGIWGVVLIGFWHAFLHRPVPTFVIVFPLLGVFLIHAQAIVSSLFGPATFVIRGHKLHLKGTIWQRLGLISGDDLWIDLSRCARVQKHMIGSKVLDSMLISKVIWFMPMKGIRGIGTKFYPMMSVWLLRYPHGKFVALLNYRIAKAHHQTASPQAVS